MFGGIPNFVDMDYINVVLAGMQAGMMNLGFCYVSEDTIADILKPFLGLFGAKVGGIYGLAAFGVAGLVSMLPQADQFYKERIWPIAKMTMGASLMGGVNHIITSALMNSFAITGISAAEQVYANYVFNQPTFDDVKMDFTSLLDYLPFASGQYDYIGNYITHYVYGMW